MGRLALVRRGSGRPERIRTKRLKGPNLQSASDAAPKRQRPAPRPHGQYQSEANRRNARATPSHPAPQNARKFCVAPLRPTKTNPTTDSPANDRDCRDNVSLGRRPNPPAGSPSPRTSHTRRKETYAKSAPPKGSSSFRSSRHFLPFHHQRAARLPYHAALLSTSPDEKPRRGGKPDRGDVGKMQRGRTQRCRSGLNFSS